MPEIDKMIAAVNGYVAAFNAGSMNAVAALYAGDATVEDPVGSPPHAGREAIRAFYAQAMKTGATLTLEGPVRIAGDFAAFPFSVSLGLGGKAQRIDVIDTFRFDNSGQIVEMRAYWGHTNMHSA